MSDDKGIVCRPLPSWPPLVAMFVALGVAWLLGWGLPVACVVGVAVNFIVAMLLPRRFGRWTE